MKKGKLKRILLFLLIIFPLNVFAEDAPTFSVSKSADNLKPGNNVTVTIKATGVSENNFINNFTANLKFDSSKLQFVDGQSDVGNVSPNGENISISYDQSKAGNSLTNEFTVATLNFTVPANAKGGNSSLTLSNTCEVNEASSECKSNSSNITIASYSNDATLSSLKIPNTTLKPAFDKNTTDYTASIKDITELTVNAVSSDSNAKIQISENYKSLQKGDNQIKIVVTSESGTNTKTYNVLVNLTLTPTDEEMLKADATLKSLTIKGQKLDFKSEEKKYYLNVDYNVKTMEVTAIPTNEKATVKINGNEKILVGKNTITIEVTSEDTNNKETYQIVVNREEEKKEIIKTCPDETSTKEWIIFSVSMLLTFTLGIVLGYYLSKKEILKKLFGKKKKKKEEPVEIETLSDTIDLSNVKKEIQKNTKNEQKKQ